jgi:hypothetical protein
VAQEADLSGRRALGFAAMVVALAAAAFLAVLAADVLRWRGQLQRADLRFRAVPGDTRVWEPDTRLPVSWSRGLLGLSDDVAFRRALQRFRLGRPGEPARDAHDVAVRSEADLALRGVADDETSPDRRSRALLLSGVLQLEDARGNGPRGGASLRRALDSFRGAIRTDPANEDAKYDLELVLRLIQSGGGQGQQRQHGPRPSGGGRGAGSSTNQSGF